MTLRFDPLRSLAILALFACLACADPVEEPLDMADAQVQDAAPPADAGTPDGGTPDAGRDAGAVLDAGVDAGTQDAQPTDSGFDAGTPDAGEPDAGVPDGGVPLVLQNPTATFSQTVLGNFSIVHAFDGQRTTGSAWAIDPNEVYQAAAVETSIDTPAYANGTRLIFRLDQHFSSEHALGRFRLSYTRADRSLFADGVDGISTPGDVGAAGLWTPITPQSQVASNGSTLTVLPDHSILAMDLDSLDAVYTVTATVPGGGLTGFRIEVIPDASLPHNGPGMQDSNGNFCLTELDIAIEPL